MTWGINELIEALESRRPDAPETQEEFLEAVRTIRFKLDDQRKLYHEIEKLDEENYELQAEIDKLQEENDELRKRIPRVTV